MADNPEPIENKPAEKRRKISVPSFSIFSIYRLFGLILIIVPLAFYFGWNIMYDDWADIGMYAFVAPTVLFGILTIALGMEKERLQKEA